MNKPNYPSEAIMLPCAALILMSIISRFPLRSIIEIPVTAGLTYCFFLHFGGISPTLDDALIFFKNRNYLFGCLKFFLMSFAASAVGAVMIFAYLFGYEINIVTSFALVVISAVLMVIGRIYFCSPEKGVKNAFYRFPELFHSLSARSIGCLLLIVILTVKQSRFPSLLRPLLTDIPESAFMAYIMRKKLDETI